jgi:hypothetical protein
VVALGGAGFAYTQFGNAPVVADASTVSPVLASTKPTVLVEDTAQIKNESPVEPVVVASTTPELPNSKTAPDVASPAVDGERGTTTFPSLPKIDAPAIPEVEPLSSPQVAVSNETHPAENEAKQNMVVAQLANTKSEVSPAQLDVKHVVVDETEKNKNAAAPIVAQGLAQMLAVKTDNHVDSVAAVNNQPAIEHHHNVKPDIAAVPTVNEGIVPSKVSKQAKADEPIKAIIVPTPTIKLETKADKKLHANVVVNKKTPSVVKIADRVVKKIIASDLSGSKNRKVVGGGVANKAVVSVSSNYAIQSAMAGEAWITKSSDLEMIQHVSVGDVVPGIGKIKSILENDGKWAVVGSLKTVY